ncbi:Thermospermine synthase ACAULIS5 [Hibiscus syriacus]|uniref:thermospermine synthase n=1 Tax=Hibiscus syriacus TaxID=106335 RepID=A0A6A2Y5X1_HIBSY|nr:Thermospermine synthase ACAULIS5 [Hibiscus syriacus]
MGEAVEIFYPNGFCNGTTKNPTVDETHQQFDSWYEETIDEDLKWSFALKSVLYKGASEYQDIALLDTKRFGKVLVIDGKMQSAEVDEFIYHECLIHPALFFHSKPKTMFIMGGGEGSAAREALRHKSIDEVVMCDIDEEVVNFCRRYLTVNRDAFCNKKLNLVINDAKAELEKRTEKFDIIVGDLADPVEGGPCYQLYTKSFYEKILKPKLNEDGIFVTQAGPAGIFTHKEVFSSIYNTIRQVFKCKILKPNLRFLYNRLNSKICVFIADVLAYTAHVPSFADTWGWVMASDQPFSIGAEEIEKRIAERVDGELLYLNGSSFLSSATMNKTVYLSLLNETHVYTEENARFIPGHGLGNHF